MADALTVKINGTALPEGVVEMKMDNELLWSEGTGRAAENGLLVGSVVAVKRTLSLTWGVLTQTQVNTLMAALPNGFFNLQVSTYNNTLVNMSAYHSAVNLGNYAGKAGNACYWKGFSVDFIER